MGPFPVARVKTLPEPYDESIMVSSLPADYYLEVKSEPYDGSILLALQLDKHLSLRALRRIHRGLVPPGCLQI